MKTRRQNFTPESRTRIFTTFPEISVKNRPNQNADENHCLKNLHQSPSGTKYFILRVEKDWRGTISITTQSKIQPMQVMRCLVMTDSSQKVVTMEE